MSTHAIANSTSVIEGLPGLRAVIAAAIRDPDQVQWNGTAAVYVFLTDLTPTEVTTFTTTVGDFRAALFSAEIGLSLVEYRAIKAQLAEIRSFRTRSLATWNALTTTQREADEISYLNDLTDVLRALLRDG